MRSVKTPRMTHERPHRRRAWRILAGLLLIVGLAQATAPPWNDSTGAHVLTPATNAYTSPGYAGDSMTLNGTMNSVANLSDATDMRIVNAWSMGGWFYATNVGVSGANDNFLTGIDGAETVLWSLGWTANGTIGAGTNGGANIVCRVANWNPACVTLHNNTWTHIAFTFTANSTTVLYVNGTAVHSIGATSGFTSTSFSGHFGWATNATPRPVVGQMDNLTFCNCTWTAPQVASFHTGTPPPNNASFYFEPGMPPTASFTYDAACLNVDFDGSISTGDPSKTFNWSFGDGSYGTNASMVTHAYAASGTYTANLTVTDANGSAVTSHPVSVASCNPSASFVYALHCGTIYADGTDSYQNILAYNWSFGDGSYGGDAPKVNHSYMPNETYYLNLTVTNASGSSVPFQSRILTVACEFSEITINGGIRIDNNYTFENTTYFNYTNATIGNDTIVNLTGNFTGNGTFLDVTAMITTVLDPYFEPLLWLGLLMWTLWVYAFPVSVACAFSFVDVFLERAIVPKGVLGLTGRFFLFAIVFIIYAIAQNPKMLLRPGRQKE